MTKKKKKKNKQTKKPTLGGKGLSNFWTAVACVIQIF
jgi:hypothetical protein